MLSGASVVFRVVSIFPNEAACLRLISAVLMEIHEAWQTDRMYMAIETNGSLSCILNYRPEHLGGFFLQAMVLYQPQEPGHSRRRLDPA